MNCIEKPFNAEQKRRAYLEAITPILEQQVRLFQLHSNMAVNIVDGKIQVVHKLPQKAQEIYDKLEELKELELSRITKQ